MPLRIVQSKQNPRLKELRKALAAPPRQMTGASPALAGIEGFNLLEEAVHAGLHMVCVFVAQGFEGQLELLDLPPETEILLLPRDLLNAALTTETPQPVAALVEPLSFAWRDLLESGPGDSTRSVPLILLLAGLQDPGNLGAILRSAEAFGASGVVCLPGTVSAWNPKAVRASAGSAFRLPLLSASADECFSQLAAARIPVWTTAVHGARPADQASLTSPLAILIGNEGNGVPAELAARAGDALTIPCPGLVESLNAAVAASIVLYEAARQRRMAR